MEQVALVQLQLAVEHVDPEEVLGLLVRGEVGRRRFQPLHRHARVALGVALAHHRALLLGQAALHQVLGVGPDLGDLLRGDQPRHDQKTLAAKEVVLPHGYAVRLGLRLRHRRRHRRDHVWLPS